MTDVAARLIAQTFAHRYVHVVEVSSTVAPKARQRRVFRVLQPEVPVSQMLTPTSNASSGRVGGLDVRIDDDHDSVVHVAGDVDFATAPPLEAALQSLVERGGAVVVDLACVEYMGAVGIHLLSDAARAIGARGRVVLRDPRPIVRLLVDITHLERLVDVVVTAPGRRVVAPSNLSIV